MKRKMIAAILATTLFTSYGMISYGASDYSTVEGGMKRVISRAIVAPKWVALENISPQFYLNAGVLHSYLIITPYSGGTIDYVKVTVNIRDVNGNSVKKWAQTLYADDIDNFVFGETYKPTAKGKYYMTADIAAYKSGSVIDTAEYESSNVAY